MIRPLKRFLTAFLLVVMLCSGFNFFVPAPIAHAAFTFYRSITIDHTKVPNTDQSNFPVLVSGTYAYLATVSNGGKVQNANGYDIGFYTNSDCSTGKMAWETEKYTAASGSVIYWVKAASLSHTSDTVFYLCYGDSSITTDQSNAAGVWDSNYKGVYHMADNAANTTVAESTSNAHTGTNAANTSAKTATGPFAGGTQGRALTYNGSTDVTNTNTHADFDITGGAKTIELWLKPNSINTFSKILFDSISSTSGWQLMYANQGVTAGGMTLLSSNPSFGDTSGSSGGGHLVSGTWVHVAISLPATGGNLYSPTWYFNGVSEANSGFLFKAAAATDNLKFMGDGGNGAWDGTLAEVRISDTNRSGDWITTEYNNQSSPSTFYSIGSELSNSTFVVSVTAPADSATVGGNAVTVTSFASSTLASVAGVKFYLDSTTQINSEVTATSGPDSYSTTWNSTGAVDGSHTLIAVGRDNLSNLATSSAITVTVDNTAPILSSFASSTNSTMATTTWTSNEVATSQIEYGLTSAYTASSSLDSSLVTSHSVSIQGLSGSTLYHYRVISVDAAGNRTNSADKTFTTSAHTPVTITSAQSGNWSSGSTWVGGAVPIDTDSVFIATGHSVVIDTNVAVGPSGTSTVPAITVQGSGSLTVGTSTTLTLHGNLISTQFATRRVWATMQPGSSLIFDSTGSPSATSTHYYVGNGLTNMWGTFKINGTQSLPVNISSNTTGGAGVGYFGPGSFSNGGFIQANWAHFTHVGDANIRAVFVEDPGAATLDIQHSTFTSSGLVQESGSRSDSTVRFNYNIMSDSKNSGGLSFEIPSGENLTSGVREIIGNYVDKTGRGGTGWQGFTITDNVFNSNIEAAMTGGQWAQFARNIVILKNGQAAPQLAGSTTESSYFIRDYEQGNPHYIAVNDGSLTYDVTVQNTGFEYTGNVVDASVDANGDLMLFGETVPSGSPRNVNVKYNLSVPSGNGVTPGSFVTEFGAGANLLKLVAEHNTIYIGDSGGGGWFSLDEGGDLSTATGSVTSIKSNLAWDTTPRNTFVNQWTQGTNPAADHIVDPYTPSHADYNWKWNIANTRSGFTYINQGLGYSVNSSIAPGQPGGAGVHDGTGDPNFVDRFRSYVTFDSKYLNVTASSTWTSGHSYSVGDVVSFSDPSYYGGNPVNFKAIQAHTADSSNKPGLGTAQSWGNYWKWDSEDSMASLYATYQANGGIVDTSLGCTIGSPCSPAETMRRWIFAGFAPQNQALKNAAHDGADIGAVSVVASSDSTSPLVSLTAPASAAVIHGSSVALTASSSDDIAVAGVKFYYDATHLIGSEITATSSPNTYSSTFDSTSVADGSHTLIAVSRDTSNNQATSSAVTVTVDNTAPVISSIATSTGATTATITWTTNETSSSQVEYGTSSSYTASTTLDASLVTSHSVTVTGLSNSTSYHFRVISVDASGNRRNGSDDTVTTTAAVVSSGGGSSGGSSGGGGGGGGLPGVYYSQPQAPVGGFSLSINSNAAQVQSPAVTLSLNAGPDTTSMVLANTPDFANALVQTYIPSIPWNLCWTNPILKIPGTCIDGQKTVYVKFRNQYGNDSGVVSATTQLLSTSGVASGNSSITQGSTTGNGLVKDHGTYYLIIDGILHGITNPGMLASYGYEFKDARTASDGDLFLPQGSLLLPGDGSLVKSAEDTTVYLISNGKRYGFTSAAVFKQQGFAFQMVLLVTDPELQSLPIAENISDGAAAHLPGLDIKRGTTIYWISPDSVLHPYSSIAIYNSWHQDNNFSFVVPANNADNALIMGNEVEARAD